MALAAKQSEALLEKRRLSVLERNQHKILAKNEKELAQTKAKEESMKRHKFERSQCRRASLGIESRVSKDIDGTISIKDFIKSRKEGLEDSNSKNSQLLEKLKYTTK